MRSIVLAILGCCLVATGACPDWAYDKEKVPLCPDHGFVGAEYPALAHLLSQNGQSQSEQDRLVQMVWKLLVHSRQRTPLLYLSGTKETLKAIRKFIDAQDISAETKKLYQGSIRMLSGEATSWLQDRIQSFVNPATGQVEMRAVQSHDSNIAPMLNELHSDCPLLEVGEPLRPFLNADGSINESSERGGNIEPICRGGFCIRGNNQSTPYARQYCTANQDYIAPADWLAVGHVDEYVATYPVPNSECDVALVVASYQEALDALRVNPKKRLVAKISDRQGFNRAFDDFCDFYEEEQLVGGIDGGKWCGQTDSEAANVHADNSELQRPCAKREKKGCDEALVSDFLKFLEGDVGKANEKIQHEVYDRVSRELKARIEAELAKRHPGKSCQVKVVEVPQIVDGEKNAGSFFPNPTNGVFVENQLLVPDPLNPLLRRRIRANLKKVGIGVSFLDSLTLHGLKGNLHCSTNTLRFCRGNGKPLVEQPYPTDDVSRVPRRLTVEDKLTVKLVEKGTSEVRARALDSILKEAQRSLFKLDPIVASDWSKRLESVVRSDFSQAGRAGALLSRMGAEGWKAWNAIYADAKPDMRAEMIRGIADEQFSSDEAEKHLPHFLKHVKDAILSDSPELNASGLVFLREAYQAREEFRPLENRVRELVAHKDLKVHEAAVRLLSHFGNLNGAELKAAVFSDSGNVRYCAAYALEYENDWTKLEVYFDKLLTDESKRTRSQTIRRAADSVHALSHLTGVLKRFPEETQETLIAFLRYGSDVAGVLLFETLLSMPDSPADRSQVLSAASEGFHVITAREFFQNAADVDLQREFIDFKHEGNGVKDRILFGALNSNHVPIVQSAYRELSKRGELTDRYYATDVIRGLTLMIDSNEIPDSEKRKLQMQLLNLGKSQTR